MTHIELKLTDSGTIDTHYYQRQAEQARAAAVRQGITWLAGKVKSLFKQRLVRVQPSTLLRPAH